MKIKINKEFFEQVLFSYSCLIERDSRLFYLCNVSLFKKAWTFNLPFFSTKAKIKRLARKFIKSKGYKTYVGDVSLFGGCLIPNTTIRLIVYQFEIKLTFCFAETLTGFSTDFFLAESGLPFPK